MTIAHQPRPARIDHASHQVAHPRQAGVATIELSLTLVILLLLAFAIVGYGALFWAKQSMNAVAADTARHALLESYTEPQPALEAAAQHYACDMIRRIAVLNAFADVQAQSDCRSVVQVMLDDMGACAPASPAEPYRCLTIRLELTVDRWPLMHTMHRLASAWAPAPGDWMPQRLVTQAKILVAPAPPFTH